MHAFRLFHTGLQQRFKIKTAFQRLSSANGRLGDRIFRGEDGTAAVSYTHLVCGSRRIQGDRVGADRHRQCRSTDRYPSKHVHPTFHLHYTRFILSLQAFSTLSYFFLLFHIIGPKKNCT